jgi:hypothetical protein
LFIVFWGFVHGVLGRSASINLLLLLAGPLCDLESRWLATIPWRYHPRLQRRGWSVDDDSLHLSGWLAGWLAGVCELQHQLLLQRHA